MPEHDTNPTKRSPGTGFSSLRAASTILLFAAAFCVLQRLTFLLRIPPFQRAPFWTPGGLLMTALLVAPLRRWWMYYFGICLGVYAAFVGDSVIPVAPAMVSTQVGFGIAASSAWAIRRFGANRPFTSTSSLLVFVACATIIAPILVTAPINLFDMGFGSVNTWATATRSVLTGTVGVLIATPALTLTVLNGADWFRARTWKRILEIGCLAACVLAVGHFVFGGAAGEKSPPALLYTPLPLLLWAAMRFELAGVCWALMIVAFQSTWGVMHGKGPFVSQSPIENIFQFQMFLIAISLPLMFLAVVIQERRHAFSALYEAQERLAHASRLAVVGELTASIAHEINQPLGAILINADAADLLLASAPASLEEVRQILDDIRKDDLRASEVIRRLRDLLRKREMRMDPVDLNEIVSEVVGLIQSEAQRRGVTIETSLSANLPLVQGDQVHLQQVLLNLVLNGIEAMDDVKGAKTLTVRTSLRQKSVEVAVTDLGRGIDQESLAKLFNPFFSTKSEGMGLGLSIARSLVEAHGGRIWAENDAARGAIFRFTVPVGIPQPQKELSNAGTGSLELIR